MGGQHLLLLLLLLAHAGHHRRRILLRKVACEGWPRRVRKGLRRVPMGRCWERGRKTESRTFPRETSARDRLVRRDRQLHRERVGVVARGRRVHSRLQLIVLVEARPVLVVVQVQVQVQVLRGKWMRSSTRQERCLDELLWRVVDHGGHMGRLEWVVVVCVSV